MCLFGSRGVEENKVDWEMVPVDLNQFKEVGQAITWNFSRCKILIPIGVAPEKERLLIWKARVNAFFRGPNYVPREMVYKHFGVAEEMAFLTGTTLASDNIITLPRREIKQEPELD